MNKKFFIVLIVVALVIVTGFGIENIYKKNNSDFESNINVYIESFEIVNITEYEGVQYYLNKSISDVIVYYEDNYEFSDFEKNIVFDLEKYDLYKLSIAVENNTNQNIVFVPSEACSESKYILVPPDFPGRLIKGFNNTFDYYYFISKDIDESDINKYLKIDGIELSICVTKDDMNEYEKFEKIALKKE